MSERVLKGAVAGATFRPFTHHGTMAMFNVPVNGRDHIAMVAVWPTGGIRLSLPSKVRFKGSPPGFVRTAIARFQEARGGHVQWKEVESGGETRFNAFILADEDDFDGEMLDMCLHLLAREVGQADAGLRENGFN